MSALVPAEEADIRVRSVSVSEDALAVTLMDGRTITAPRPGILAWQTARRISGHVGS